jgi:hopanoid biosynthesis associated radical SAM protein HpnH
MGIPLRQQVRVGSYVLKQTLLGKKRYPLVLMLEPLYRCNLACAGCGKIDYPDEILNQRLSYQECMDSIDECGAPGVVIAGGEPLLHKELPKIVEGALARKKMTIVCTNALLLLKKIDQYKPNPYFSWSIHLDGDEGQHDASVCQEGVYEKCIEAIKVAKARGFRTQINATLFNNADPDRIAKFFDTMMEMGLDGITVSPGYAYERAPDQQHFLNRDTTKTLFRNILSQNKNRKAEGKKKWSFTQSDLFMNFLAGNETYACSPWSMPARNVFGWQKPCYLLGEGYVSTFKELMESTDWDTYGVGNYEKCSDCMVHCGFEGTAVTDSVKHPLKALKVAIGGIRTEGEYAPEIDITKARPAQYVFSAHVEQALHKIRTGSITVEKTPELVDGE